LIGSIGMLARTALIGIAPKRGAADIMAAPAHPIHQRLEGTTAICASRRETEADVKRLFR
jgi:hypothetical protein